jgi:flagellar hook-length control protein FliK
MSMPSAVANLFSAGGIMPSAPAVKPSSPQAPEGSSDFQLMLGQAKPRPQSADNNKDQSAAKIEKSDKPRSASHVSHKGKVQGVQKKASANQSADEDQASDGESTQEAGAATVADNSPAADVSQPKPTDAPSKAAAAKKAQSSPDVDETQQVLASQSATKVQPVDQKKQQEQPAGKEQTAAPKVRAINSDGEDTPVQSPSAPADSISNSAPPTAPLPVTARAAATGQAKQKAAIQPAANSASDAVQAQSALPADLAQAITTDDSDGAADAEATTASATEHDASAAHAAAHAADASFADVVGAIQSPADKASSNAPLAAPAASAPAPPEAQFAQANHNTIISGIHGQLLPTGGSMQVRLDPPELGALSVIVRVHEGVMSASFETSNDQATRLLSHSLAQLKSSLEAQGVSVGKLHVQQAPRGQQSSTSDDQRSQDNGNPDSAAQREQQRREMLRRMWRRLNGTGDPLDLVA